MDAANLPKNDELHTTARAGVLIVQNGRQAGARRPLGVLTTFVGRAPNCDVRLNVDGVAALHCLLVDTPHGIQLRDLNSVHGTFVNGVRVETAMLHHGDLLKVGPFQFRLDRPSTTVEHDAPSTPADERLRDALRIQTAAVAAQQIALEEEEARLDQRRQDLQRQEQQLAAHLEEKQHQLQIWSDFTRSEKETLRQQKLDFEKAQTRQEEELAHAQNRLVNEQKQVKLERQRIDKIYQRLKQRWKIQWAAEKERHLNLIRKIQDDAFQLEEHRKAFEAQRVDFAQQVIQFNTERELSQRNLNDLRDGLAKDQDRWRQRNSLERHALAMKQREIDDAHAKLQQVRQMIQADKDAWADQQAILQKELLGLNNRVVTHRMQLDALEVALAQRAQLVRAGDAEPIECEVEVIEDSPVPALATAIPADDQWRRHEAVVEMLLSELSDQRLHLLEQFQRLAAIQQDWRSQRECAANELDALAHRLVAQEASLVARDQQTVAQEHRIAQRHEELEGLRQEILIWRGQVSSRERAFTDEHARQLLELQGRERSLEEQLASLTELRERWNQRRQHEVDRQKELRIRVDVQQKEVNELRAALFANSQQVEQEKRLVAEKSLALEQYRQELFARADDPNAQNRIERLRRRWLSINAGLIRNAKGERESVRKELDRLDDVHTQLARESSRLERMEKELAEKQALLDEREARLQAMQAKLKHENQRLGNLEHRAESKVLRIQEEVETLASTMYEEPESVEKAA